MSSDVAIFISIAASGLPIKCFFEAFLSPCDSPLLSVGGESDRAARLTEVTLTFINSAPFG